MKFPLFSFATFILLIILSKFVVKGLKFKFKIQLISAAFLLVLVSYSANLFYPIWTVGLMVFVLAGCLAYFLTMQLQKREVLLDDEGVLNHDAKVPERETIPTEKAASILNEVSIPVAPLMQVDELDNDIKEIILQDLHESLDQVAAVVELEPQLIEPEPTNSEQIQLEPIELDSIELKVTKLESIKFDETFLSDLQPAQVDLFMMEDTGYQNAAVPHLEDEPQGITFEQISDEHLKDVKEELPVRSWLVDEDLLEGDLEDPQLEQPRNSLFAQLDEMQGFNKENIAPSKVPVDEALLEEENDYKPEEELEQTPVLLQVLHEESMDGIPFTISNDSPENPPEVELEFVSTVKDDFFKNLLNQLNWMKQNATSSQFENFLNSYLKTSLSDKEFYILSAYMRDHLIETKQYLVAEKLLLELRERYEQYEWLKVEIDNYLRYVKTRTN